MAETEAFAARLLEALPALRPRYDAVAAECRAEGLGDAIPDVFLDEYSRELLDRPDLAVPQAEPMGSSPATPRIRPELG